MRTAIVVLAAASLFACTGPGNVDNVDGEPGDVDGGVARNVQIDWRTSATLFRASAVSIYAGGNEFRVATDDVHLGPGAAIAGYTTLEATWREHGVEMRLFIYLWSDGVEWWSDEIRTYDGAAQGEWVTYHGDFFRSPVDMPFVGSLVVGGLRLEGVFMKAFLSPECDGAPYFLETLTSVVGLIVDPSASFVLPARLRDAACAEISAPAGTTFEWTVLDPSIASVVPASPLFVTSAEFHGIAVGSTMGRLVMRNGDGAELASRTFPVLVDPKMP